MRAVLTALCILITARGTSAQVRTVADADLPRGVAAQLQAIIDAPGTERFTGPTTIEAWHVIASSVAVLDGLLTIAGRVDGDVVVVSGDLLFESGAIVAGNVTVVDGSLRGAEHASIGGTVTVYGEGFSIYRRGERLVTTRRSHDRTWHDRYGRSDFVVRVGDNYNRVEGLPLQFGPRISTAGRSPLNLEALAIWRTATGSLFDTRDMGYVVRAEQFLGGRDLRIGASVRSTVQPIETWAVSDLEASLAAAVLHEDMRDYFERTGWSAYVRLAPRRSPIDVTLAYRNEDHSTVPVRDPWTVFDRGQMWRAQPLIAEGNIGLLSGSAELDLRRGRDFRTRGWLIRGEIDHRLAGDLRLTGITAEPDAITHFDHPFTTALLDVRQYRPVGPDAVLGLRAIAGGSIRAEPVPPQFQHALGGAGSLPGYSAFSIDCGARRMTVSVGAADDEQTFFPSYGCDRFALLQAEYRGGFGFRLGGHDPRDKGWGWRVDASPNWIVFFDAAQGWAFEPTGRSRTGAMYDVGAGIILGGFGIYGALPLSTEDRGLNLFVRLGPRF